MRTLQALGERFSHVNWALADQAIISAANFATTILIARFLGLEEFGRFALAWLAIFFGQNFQIALLITPMMTIGAKQASRDRPAYTGAVMVQQAVLSAVTVCVVFGVLSLSDLFFPDWRLTALALPVTLAVLFGQAAEFLRRYCFTFSMPRTSFIVDGIRYGGQIALLLALFLLFSAEASTATVFYCISLTALLSLLAGLPALRGWSFTRAMTETIARRHWRFARWLAPSVFSLWARENLVYTIVGAKLGLAEVGILRAAQQIVTMVNVPLHGFANVVPMRAGEAFSGRGYGGLVDFISDFVLRYKAGILVLLIAISLLGDVLLNLFYGKEYAGNGALVAAFACVMMVHLARNAIAIMVQAMEETAFEFYASAASILLMVVAVHPLVQGFGLAGAMLAYALYECAALVAISFGLRSPAKAGMRRSVSQSGSAL